MKYLRTGRANQGSARSRAVFCLYLACMLLVFSFIFFEVLDVDASDFPQPVKASIKLVEPPHDLKRSIGSSEGLIVVPPRGDAAPRPLGPVLMRARLVLPQGRAFRIALPRAALPDPLPTV